MKHSQALFAACLLAAAPAASYAAPQSPSSPQEVEELEQRLDEAVQNLQRHARERGATREHYERVMNLLDQRADATQSEYSKSQEMRSRLVGAVQQIEQNAREAFAEAEDFAAFQEQVLDERLDRWMEELERHVRSRSGDRTAYSRVSSLLQQRAEHADFSPDADEFRQRAQNAIDEIVGKAGGGFDVSADFASLRIEILKDQVRRAAIDVQRQVRSRGADRTTYQRLLNLLLDRAEIDPDFVPGVTRD